ncbi:MAG: hypothetical protein MR008_02350 [Aerococcus sp.]|nr:hypothetical protein [Aerococcus sp.]
MNEKHRTNAFQRIIFAFKTRWLLPFLGGLIGLTVGLVLAFAVVTPTYESQSQVIVDQQGKTANTDIYEETLTSSTVLDPVVKAVPEVTAADDFVDDIAVNVQEDTGVVTISARNRSPKVAAQINQQLTSSFIQSAPKLLATEKVALLSKVSTPTQPIAPSAWLYGLVGTLIGVSVMAVIVIVQALRDDLIYSESIVSDLGWELVGVLPEISQEEIALTRFKSNQPPMASDDTKRRL